MKKLKSKENFRVALKLAHKILRRYAELEAKIC
jgi:hypothetical protein